VERAAFLIEDTGERLACLLNPEGLVLRRQAGIKLRETAGGLVSGSNLADDPLLLTGGGTTELTLDLLFDVSVAGSTITSNDVRDLTGPLWELAENSRQVGSYGRPPVARFVWGKSWNVPGVVVAVAERLEYFDPNGAPQRSWLRMRLIRVVEPADIVNRPPLRLSRPSEQPQHGFEVPGPDIEVHQITGAAPGEGEEAVTGERLDHIAHRYYGDPGLWRALAIRNGLADPLHLPPGQLLEIPPSTDLEPSP